MKSTFLILMLAMALLPTYALVTLETPSCATVVFALPDQANQTNQTGIPNLSIDRAFYKPTKIIFNFPATTNVHLRDVTTIGASSYTYDGTPTTFTFICKDVDIYTFVLQLDYENASTRLCLVGVSQGNLPMEGYTVRMDEASTVISVKLNLTEQPSYPSVESVAQETVHQMEQLIATQIQQNADLLTELQTTVATTAIVSMISVICAIVTLVLVLWFTSRVKRGATTV